MISCKEAAKFFYPYMDKELSPEDVTILEQHMKDCQPCVGHLEFDRALRKLVKRHAAGSEVSTNFKERIMDKISESESDDA